MGRPTDTNDIRTYCLNHIGGVFDTNYLSKHLFYNVPVANFRKYVTRFEKEGLLRKVSKGLFMIGESELSDRDRLIAHYTKDGACAVGLIGGVDLLNDLGLAKLKRITTIYSNRAVGIKHLTEFGVDVIESHASYGYILGSTNINVALELMSLRHFISVDDELSYYKKLRELLSRYDDNQLIMYVDFSLYPRQVFILLANFLDSMHISNRVMEIYAYKTRNTISKE